MPSSFLDELRGAPWWAKLLIFAGAAGLTRAAYGAMSGPLPLDEALLADAYGYDAGRLQIIRWLLDEWHREGTLRPDEQAALLAVAAKESGFRLRAVSAPGAPDDAGGRAWGLFQFLAITLKGLGFDLEEVRPVLGAGGVVPERELERASRGSARVAVAFLVKQRPRWAGRRPYLDAIRELHPDDHTALAREIFVAWNAGPGRTWADIARVAKNATPGTLGYVHYTVERKLAVYPTFRRAVGLGG